MGNCVQKSSRCISSRQRNRTTSSRRLVQFREQNNDETPNQCQQNNQINQVNVASVSVNNPIDCADIQIVPDNSEQADIVSSNLTKTAKKSFRRKKTDSKSQTAVQPTTTSQAATSNYIHSSSSFIGNGAYYIPPTGKNKRLKKDIYKYFKCDKRISEEQLQAKREEFWHTAPAFEGKIEIWAALRAAVDAYEAKNYQLAQAIIDSANIILPNGLLNDCYDELGNRYQIPIYVLARPTNMIRPRGQKNTENENSSSYSTSSNRAKLVENTNEDHSTHDLDEIINDYDEDEDEEDDDDDDYMDNIEIYYFNSNNKHDAGKKKKSNNAKKNKLSFLSSKSQQKSKTNVNNKLGKSTVSPTSTQNDTKLDVNKQEATLNNEEILQVKLRVSSMNEDNDLKINVSLNENVASLKTKIKNQINIDESNQRLFFAGKQMKDKDKLRVHKLKRNVVIQVIVREKPKDQLKYQNDVVIHKSNVNNSSKIINEQIEPV